MSIASDIRHIRNVQGEALAAIKANVEATNRLEQCVTELVELLKKQFEDPVVGVGVGPIETSPH